MLCILLTLAGFSPFTSTFSSILTTPIPLITWPNTTCFPSRWGVGTVVMKNWEPLVPGPAFAMLSRPGLSCCIEGEKNHHQHLKHVIKPYVRFHKADHKHSQDSQNNLVNKLHTGGQLILPAMTAEGKCSALGLYLPPTKLASTATCDLML